MTDVQKLYEEAIVIDGLNVSNWDSPAVYESLSAGGVTAINATIATWENYVQTLGHIEAWMRRFSARAETVAQIRTVGDITAAKEEGKAGVILGFQNASPMENELGHLAVFHALGVRIIQLTFHERNLLGDGCFESANAGLSNIGRDAVREMNRLGILIDLSHVGERSTMETIDHSEKPVAVTHANCRSYFDHPRNKTDAAVKRLAERGGVVGATAIGTFLRSQFDSDLEDFIDAIDDMAGRIGIDHVAFGSDFTQDQPPSFWRYIGSQQGTRFPSTFTDEDTRYDLMALYPRGLETPDKLPNLAVALDKRGYSNEDIKKVLGGNWLRLFREVWGE